MIAVTAAMNSASPLLKATEQLAWVLLHVTSGHHLSMSTIPLDTDLLWGSSDPAQFESA